MIFRIPRSTLEIMRSDLVRRHPFAHERVGFVTVRQSEGHNGEVICLATGYVPVPDEHYIRDRFSGARIGTLAIRSALQLSLDEGVGLFHVHIHDHTGVPGFSMTDIAETSRLVSSFANTKPEMIHGMLLLSQDAIIARAIEPGATELRDVEKITVVGWPMEFHEPHLYE